MELQPTRQGCDTRCWCQEFTAHWPPWRTCNPLPWEPLPCHPSQPRSAAQSLLQSSSCVSSAQLSELSEQWAAQTSLQHLRTPFSSAMPRPCFAGGSSCLSSASWPESRWICSVVLALPAAPLWLMALLCLSGCCPWLLAHLPLQILFCCCLTPCPWRKHAWFLTSLADRISHFIRKSSLKPKEKSTPFFLLKTFYWKPQKQGNCWINIFKLNLEVQQTPFHTQKTMITE